MKNFFPHLIMLVAVLSASCQSDITQQVEYKLGADGFTFNMEGGVRELFVQTTASVKAVCEDSWCIVTDENYPSDKISKFEVTVLENSTTSDRSTIITLNIGDNITETIPVKQSANPLNISVRTVSLDAQSQDFEVAVDAASDYNVTTESYWITVKSKAHAKTVFSAQKNIAQTSRSAEIIFSAGGVDIVVTVSQAGSLADVPDPDMTGMGSDAKTLMKKMTLGINLGNTLEATGGELAWGAPKTTEAIIKYFKQLGFNAVRIPCSWNQWLEPGDDYIVKDTWMNRVKEVVDYVVKNDMYAILNIHWDQGWLENDIKNGYDEAVNDKQKAIWTQIATVFRDYDEHLLFAGTNEPNVENASHMSTLLKYEQTFIDAVRATGGRNAYRVLVFQGPSTDIDKTVSLMNTLPTDKVEGRLAAEVHYYTPWQFCGMAEDENWGKMAFFWGDEMQYYATGSYSERWVAGTNEDYVSGQMAKMKKKFWDNGIPVIIGEFGADSWRTCNLGSAAENTKAEEGYRKSLALFNACVVRESKSNGCVPFYWHCEDDMIDRSALRVNDQERLDAIVEAGTTQYPD